MASPLSRRLLLADILGHPTASDDRVRAGRLVADQIAISCASSVGHTMLRFVWLNQPWRFCCSHNIEGVAPWCRMVGLGRNTSGMRPARGRKTRRCRALCQGSGCECHSWAMSSHPHRKRSSSVVIWVLAQIDPPTYRYRRQGCGQ